MQGESVQDLEREALAAVAGAPLDQVGEVLPPEVLAAGPTEAEILAGYEMVCTELLDQGCTAIVPAWQVTPHEVGRLSTACSKALLLWFPDMIIPPKYMALLVIAGVGFEIAKARRDPDTGRYRPARLPEPAGKNPDQAGAAAH
jgi:hypothetical protein